jgi:hypothetical protein
MKDIEIMIKNYWEKFEMLFPNVSKNQFADWVEEDVYTGWEEAGHNHSAGRRELKMLYVTLRAVKPKNILEIGTYKGDSSNHVLLACENNKKEGFPCEVTLLDIKNYMDKPLHNYPYNRVLENSIYYLPKNNHDFIIQDGSHTYNMVKKELQLFSKNSSLNTVWAHDYHLPGRGVKQAWDELGSKVFNEWISFKEDAYPPGFVIAKKII